MRTSQAKHTGFKTLDSPSANDFLDNYESVVYQIYANSKLNHFHRTKNLSISNIIYQIISEI